MNKVVFVLCALTSLGCAALLLRGYLRSRTRLLFWSSVCFVLLGLNNVLLVADRILLPDVDLGLARSLTSFAAVTLLLYGLIRDTR